MEQLKVNGVEHTFAPDEMPATLSELIATLGVKAPAAVAEVDGQIVRPEAFATTPVRGGQTIELVRFMGGG